MPTKFKKDKELNFPNITVVDASAGSGKTQALAMRYLQLLLSDEIPHNGLKNILAITFTRNTAKEMKQRIITTLKKVALNDSDAIPEVQKFVESSPKQLTTKSIKLLDEIFQNYDSLQIQTIDSFVTQIFRALSFELGYGWNFEVVLDYNEQLEEAFHRYSQRLVEEKKSIEVLEGIIELIKSTEWSEKRFLWDPYRKILEEVKGIYQKYSRKVGKPKIQDYSEEIKRLKEEIINDTKEYNRIVDESGFKKKIHFQEIIDNVINGNISQVGRLKSYLPPVLKSSGESYDLLVKRTMILHPIIEEKYRKYVEFRSLQFYQPYVAMLILLTRELSEWQNNNRKIFLDDIKKLLVRDISNEVIPLLYFQFGDKIKHFLIDEFQDTTPLQWDGLLKPLISEALSGAGSLFAVGDTKQSIFLFTGANWEIMKRLKAGKEFSSLSPDIVELQSNYRSGEIIVEFNRKLFHEIIPSIAYGNEASESGLTTYTQSSIKKLKNRGFVNVVCVERNEEQEEHDKIISIIEDCINRGFSYGDIAILTRRNDDVVEISKWLNARDIPFLPYSSLDIRKRKIISEIISLLKFLHSPVDDLAFSTFILGDIFTKAIETDRSNLTHTFLQNWILQSRLESSSEPLYSKFRRQYTDIWSKNFEKSFRKSGFAPLYDLVSGIMKTFNVFNNFTEEESALIRLLEVIHICEGESKTTLHTFLDLTNAEGEVERWQMLPQPGINAIRVMTIHKAKGLGFPIVIALLYDHQIRIDNTQVIEENGELTFLRLSRNEEVVPKFKEKYDDRKKSQTIDDLNTLYVALTRSHQELYVISIKGRDKFPSEYFEGISGSYGAKSKPDTKLQVPQNRLQPFHHNKEAEFIPASVSVVTPQSARGEAIHSVLASIDSIDDDFENYLRSLCSLYVDEGEQTDIFELLKNLLKRKDVFPYFERKAGRRILREHTMISSDSSRYRPDRIINDSNVVTVIDFKTGETDLEGEYKQQILNYTKILQEVFPSHQIKGVLLFVDKGIIKEVL